MNRFRQRFRYIYLKTDSVLLPLISGWVASVIGFILALPAHTFTTSATYEAMTIILPEFGWGFVFLFFGIMQMVVSFFNYHWRVQAYVSLFGLGLWIFFSALIIIANPITTGTAPYPALAAICLGRFYRCFQDKERL